VRIFEGECTFSTWWRASFPSSNCFILVVQASRGAMVDKVKEACTNLAKAYKPDKVYRISEPTWADTFQFSPGDTDGVGIVVGPGKGRLWIVKSKDPGDTDGVEIVVGPEKGRLLIAKSEDPPMEIVSDQPKLYPFTGHCIVEGLFWVVFINKSII